MQLRDCAMSDLMTSFSKELITDINVDKQHIQFEKLLINSEGQKLNYRFYLVDEISEGKSKEYRLSMANVIANLNQGDSSMVYLLSGTPQGIQLYIGVAGEKDIDVDQSMLKNAFQGNFIGSKLTTISVDDQSFLSLFDRSKHIGLLTGIPSFNEEEQNVDGEEFQGIERLAKTLSDTYWQLLLVAEPGSEDEIRQSLAELYTFSTALSSHIKHSIQQSENSGRNTSETHGTSDSRTVGDSESYSKGSSSGSSRSKNWNHSTNSGSSSGKAGSSGTWNESTNRGSSKTEGSSESTNTGTNESRTYGKTSSDTVGTTKSFTAGKSVGEAFSLTREQTNKQVEHIQTHINDYQIPRHVLGLSKGMFRTAVYLCAQDKESYNRLVGSVKSIFQGTKATLSPLEVTKLPQNKVSLVDLLSLKKLPSQKISAIQRVSTIVHSTPLLGSNEILGATWLNTNELSLLAGLPTEELPGIKLRKSVSFAVNTDELQDPKEMLSLGNLIQDGRELSHKPLALRKKDLDKHLFVTGVTGSGKTTTCMNILLGSGFPFMVVEPAKTEYRALYEINQDIQYYSLGREDLTTFRLNPFELISPEQNLTGHVSMLKSTMTAVFPMEASMPFIVEQAIMKAYENKGWDIASSTNFFVDDPWESEENVWPTFSDMIGELEGVIKSAGMGQEFEQKYLGSLVSRLSALTQGIKGAMINTIHSMDFDQLLDQKVVIELEELKDEEDKAFFMALILGRVAETMKYRHRKDNDFKHMTLIEEAHRLLSKPEPGADGSKAMGVEMFANLLSEVRKYGECLIIADQIPNKLISDVIKNTNIKIVHRLFAADDRDAIGDAIGLNRDQKDFLPLLKPGETVVYSGGWHAPVRAQIKQLANTTGQEIQESEIAHKGKQQLWNQRSSLFPQLSEANAFSDPDTFATFIREGRNILNILIRICNTYKKDHDSPLLSRLIDRLRKNIIEMNEKIGMGHRLSSLQLAMLCNDSLVPAWGLGSQKGFKEKLPDVLDGLLNFDNEHFISLIKSKEFNEYFVNKPGLVNYQSI